MLSLVYKRALPWGEDDWEFLLDIGSVLGVFIQRLQMQKKDLDLRVLRERKQLSSEIHDNISQMASALAIHADIAQECLDDGDVDGAKKELEALGDQSRQITKVLREEMLSLRTPVEVEGNLLAVLEGMLQRFSAQWDVDADLSLDCMEVPPITQYAMLQLIRIVNEALQNVLRHSRATAVRVVILRRACRVRIDVSDNGIGFDPDSVAPERLGIRIMRERAESVDGSLSVRSGLQGTTVSLELPISRS